MKKFPIKNQNNKNSLLYAAIMLVIFAAFSLAYNYPVLTGVNALSQPDIINYKGSAEEMINFQEKTGENIYWSDAMFGGMPTFQNGANYDGYWVKKIDEVLRFLPRPADYIFLLLSGFFFLGLVVFKNWKHAALASFMFALGTYFFIVIEAGHNAKVHAIAYFPPLMASIILLFRGKYIWGFLLTTLFMALELVASHPQMTYYFGFVVFFYLLLEFFEAFKSKNLKKYFIPFGLAITAVILAFGMNSSPLLATQEYAKYSTRGNNDVTLYEDANKSGLDKEYITHWSYGKLETLNLFIPNFMGGGSIAPEGSKKNLQKAIQNNARSQEEYNYFSQYSNYLSTYWGNQPFTSGPAYQGAIVFFLFILGCVLVPGKWKWWLLVSTLFSVFLAWGKNMMWLTDLFIDYVPFYDKFRAVSSILVIAEFAMPLLAAFAVYYIFKEKFLKPSKIYNQTLYVSIGTISFLILIYLLGPSLFSFSTEIDAQMPDFMANGIKADRIELFKEDTIRTLVFVVLAAFLLLAYLKKYIKRKEIVIGGLALLTIIDLWGVDKRYLNNDDFINKQWVENPFPTQISQRLSNEIQQGKPALMQIASKVPMNKALSDLKAQDNSHYRVYNTAANTFNETGTSYFTSSLGGYHGAKLQNYQNIIDIYFSNDSVKMKQLGVLGGRTNILNLLNTKYVVIGESQEPQIIENPNALGNAWFVKKTLTTPSSDSAVVKISNIDVTEEATVPSNGKVYDLNSSDSKIELVDYNPSHLIFHTENDEDGFAVFSEIYYPKGWVALIDGKEKPMVQTNYFLRGLEIPAGNHKVELIFSPDVIKTGKKIMIASNILFILLFLGGILYQFKFKKKNGQLF